MPISALFAPRLQVPATLLPTHCGPFDPPPCLSDELEESIAMGVSRLADSLRYIHRNRLLS